MQASCQPLGHASYPHVSHVHTSSPNLSRFSFLSQSLMSLIPLHRQNASRSSPLMYAWPLAQASPFTCRSSLHRVSMTSFFCCLPQPSPSLYSALLSPSTMLQVSTTSSVFFLHYIPRQSRFYALAPLSSLDLSLIGKDSNMVLCSLINGFNPTPLPEKFL